MRANGAYKTHGTYVWESCSCSSSEVLDALPVGHLRTIVRQKSRLGTQVLSIEYEYGETSPTALPGRGRARRRRK
jgi:hypothetical protein